MPIFATSTQKKHWLFSSQERVNEIRNETHKKTVEYLQDLFKRKNAKKIPEFLNLDEENLIRRIYEQNITTIAKNFCKKFNFPIHVEATSLIFFKRFFLHHSPMLYEPMHVMLSCIYLACKVEEHHIAVNTFVDVMFDISKTLKVTPETILKMELIILEGLKFHLVVHHPYRSLDAFIHDFQNVTKETTINFEQLHSTSRKCLTLVTSSSDVSFLYTPGCIALGAISHSCAEIGASTHFKTYLEKRFSANLAEVEKNVATIVDIIKQCAIEQQNMASKTQLINQTVKKLTKLRKRVEKYISEEEKAIKEQRDKEREEKRLQKLLKMAEKEKLDEQKLLS